MLKEVIFNTRLFIVTGATLTENHFATAHDVALVIVTCGPIKQSQSYKIEYKGGSRGGDRGSGPPWNFGKKVVIRFVIGTGLILHSIYVNYSHKSKKGSKCGDLMVRT